jgi:hypothetical protein
MPILDLTQSTPKNVVEITNLSTLHTVELNAGLLLSQEVTGGGAAFPSATTGQYLQYNGTEWVAVDLTLTGGTITSDIVVTDSVGNVTAGTTISAGTSIEDLLNDMMVSYQAPVMSLTNWTTGTYEHGATYPTDTDFTLSFTNDSNIDTGVTGAWSISDSFIMAASGTAAAADGTTTIPAYTGTLLVTNSNAGVSTTHRSSAAKLTVSGFQNTNGNSIGQKNRSSTVRFRYWVLESTTALSQNPTALSAQIALLTADLQLDGTGSDVIKSGLMDGVGNLSFTAAGGYDYVYFLLPQAFTVNNIVQNTSLNLYAGDTADQTTAVIFLGNVQVTNQHGEDVAMQVLRSKVSNAFASGSAIAFS